MVYSNHYSSLYKLLSSNNIWWSNSAKTIIMALISFPIMIIGGGLEEIGWRGILQPALQKRFSEFFSTIISERYMGYLALAVMVYSGHESNSKGFSSLYNYDNCRIFLIKSQLLTQLKVFLCV